MTEYTSIQDLLMEDISWDELLERLDIKDIVLVDNTSRFRASAFLIKSDGSFYETRYSITAIQHLAIDWNSFRKLAPGVKQEVISAITENYADGSIGGPLRYREMQFSEFIREQGKAGNSTITSTISLSSGSIELAKEPENEDGS
jgi:hypothetical protein